MLVRGKYLKIYWQLFGYHLSCSTTTSFHHSLWSVTKCQCDILYQCDIIFQLHALLFIYFLHLSLFHHRCRLSPHTSTLLFASFPTCPQVFQGLLLLISSQSRPWSLRCPSCSSPCSPCVKTRKIWDPLHSHNRSELIILLLTFQPFQWVNHAQTSLCLPWVSCFLSRNFQVIFHLKKKKKNQIIIIEK